MADRAYLERLSRELTDKGKLIEAGWVSLRLAAIPPNAPAVQLQEKRNAFFAGDLGTEAVGDHQQGREVVRPDVAARRSKPDPALHAVEDRSHHR